MTAPNPFVAAATDPVTFFAWLGYALFLLALAIWTAGTTWRLTLSLYATLATDSRWPIAADLAGPRQSKWKYAPPARFIALAGIVPFLLAVLAWAVGGVAFLLAP